MPTKPTTETAEAEVVETTLLPAVSDAQVPMPTDHQMLANLQTDDEWSDVDAGDLEPNPVGGWRIPYLKQNRKTGELGTGVMFPETGELVLTFDFIWLAKGRSRVWFEESYGKGEKIPQCRSFDAQKADPASPQLQNDGDCSTCPRASWGPDNPDKDHPCRDSIEALIFLPDPHGVGRLARIRWGGLSAKPARGYWDSFFTRLPKRPPIAFVSRVTYEEEKLDNGTFLVPRFERLAEISRAEAQPLIDERDRRLADWQADTADDVTAGVDAKEPEPFDPGQPGVVPSQAGTDEEPF